MLIYQNKFHENLKNTAMPLDKKYFQTLN